MTFTQIWLNSYFHPRQSLDELAKQQTPHYGALYTLLRGVLLGLLFYLPLYLLKFEPVSPAYLAAFDTPRYYLYAVFIWPIFALVTWAYLNGAVYVLLRLLGYQVNFDMLLNLGGLLNLMLGVLIILFDWLMVPLGLHPNYVFLGIMHVLIADTWEIVLSAYFFKKYFSVPIWLTIVSGILLRILYMPLGIVFIRT